MAYIFYEAINQAYNDGRIAAATPIDNLAATGCDKVFGDGISAGGLTQTGAGQNDGTYSHNSQDMGIRFTKVNSPWDRNQWHFARLFGRQYDDLVAWVSDTPSSGQNSYYVWKNSADGEGQFIGIDIMFVGMYCNPPGIHFIDMNGTSLVFLHHTCYHNGLYLSCVLTIPIADGLDDLVCVSPEGDLWLAINNGDGNGNTPPTFTSMGLIKDNEGYPQARIVLGDIDGDGRGDYGVVDDAGDVSFWRNGWVDDTPKYWEPLGVRFPNPGLGDNLGFRFEDINGDGRDDALWMTEYGATYAWTNSRSCESGVEGDGLKVTWRQGFWLSETSGPAYLGVGQFVTDTETNLRPRVHFARIFGDRQDFIALPRQDFVVSNTLSAGSSLWPDGFQIPASPYTNTLLITRRG